MFCFTEPFHFEFCSIDYSLNFFQWPNEIMKGSKCDMFMYGDKCLLGLAVH